jgi:fumarate hydratase subunit beta
VAFEDAGPEALFQFEVVNFPAVVINDLEGNDYYEMVTAERLGVKYEKTI